MKHFKHSFLEDNNQFLIKTNELIRHYDEQVIEEQEKFIKEVEEKCKNKRINNTAKTSAHSSFEREFRNNKNSQSENFGNRNKILNRQSVQFDPEKKPRELWQKQSENYDTRRKDDHRNFDTDDSEPVEIRENLNQNRTRRSMILNSSTRRSQVNQYNQDIVGDSDLSDNNHTVPTTHFPFGMTQTPFQIISNWPLEFRNNKEDSQLIFWMTLKDLKGDSK